MPSTPYDVTIEGQTRYDRRSVGTHSSAGPQRSGITAIVAGVLAVPGGVLAGLGERAAPAGTSGSHASHQLAADAPTPNQDFTPAVQTRSGSEDEDGEEE